jgi:hypothetical protein
MRQHLVQDILRGVAQDDDVKSARPWRLRGQDWTAFRRTSAARGFLTVAGGVDTCALARAAVTWLVRHGYDSREHACSAGRLALALWQLDAPSGAVFTAMLKALRRALRPTGPALEAGYEIGGGFGYTTRVLPSPLPGYHPVDRAYFVRRLPE